MEYLYISFSMFFFGNDFLTSHFDSKKCLKGNRKSNKKVFNSFWFFFLQVSFFLSTSCLSKVIYLIYIGWPFCWIALFMLRLVTREKWISFKSLKNAINFIFENRFIWKNGLSRKVRKLKFSCFINLSKSQGWNTWKFLIRFNQRRRKTPRNPSHLHNTWFLQSSPLYFTSGPSKIPHTWESPWPELKQEGSHWFTSYFYSPVPLNPKKIPFFVFPITPSHPCLALVHNKK